MEADLRGTRHQFRMAPASFKATAAFTAEAPAQSPAHACCGKRQKGRGERVANCSSVALPLLGTYGKWLMPTANTTASPSQYRFGRLQLIAAGI